MLNHNTSYIFVHPRWTLLESDVVCTFLVLDFRVLPVVLRVCQHVRWRYGATASRIPSLETLDALRMMTDTRMSDGYPFAEDLQGGHRFLQSRVHPLLSIPRGHLEELPVYSGTHLTNQESLHGDSVLHKARTEGNETNAK